MSNPRETYGNLFEPSPISEEVVRRNLEPVMASLWDLIESCWNDLCHYREADQNFHDMSHCDIAGFVTSLAYRRAKKLFDGDPTVKVRELNGKPVLIVADKYEMKIKKLTKRKLRPNGQYELTRSNYPTPTDLAYYSQMPVQNGTDLPRLVLGYQLIKEATEIKIWIAFPRRKTRGMLWSFEMSPPIAAYRPKLVVSAADHQDDLEKKFEILSANEEQQESRGSS